MRRYVSVALATLIFANPPAYAATEQKICTRHSTIVLEPGEKAEVNGAGSSGVELLISGPAGQWIFADFNGLSAPGAGDVEVASTKTQTIFRRGHAPQIYAIYSKASRMIEGKQLTAFISGLYLDRATARQSPDQEHRRRQDGLEPRPAGSDCQLRPALGAGQGLVK